MLDRGAQVAPEPVRVVVIGSEGQPADPPARSRRGPLGEEDGLAVARWGDDDRDALARREVEEREQPPALDRDRGDLREQ
jgi:hypothetical protein